MSDTSTGDPEKPMEQSNNNLSKAMEQPSATTDKSDETSTPPKNLSDMPIHVVGLIIERSDYRQQLKLRKVSKTLRALGDKQKPSCKSIRIECCEENVNLIFDDQHVMYTKQIDDDDGEDDYEDEDDYGIVVLREDFKKAAFDDLASTLKNPKLQLEKFCTSESVFSKKDLEDYYNGIQCVLESLNHQVSVKEIEFRVQSPSHLLSILSHLKPGVLEKISLSIDHRGDDWRNDSNGMDQIALPEQWKQAKELELEDAFDEFPMKHATHFKRFQLVESHMGRNKLIRIKNFLSKLDNFEQCTLSYFGFGFRGLISNVLGAPVSSNALEKVFHQPIPDSDYYLEIKLATISQALEITKKKRESN